MYKIIISLQEYNSLKEKAEKWDKSQFSPELINEKIKSDLERLYCSRYRVTMETIRSGIDDIISDFPNNSLFSLTSYKWIKHKLNKLDTCLKQEIPLIRE